MAKNSVKLQLHGNVLINDFATAIESLAGLINALSDEIAGPVEIDWQITELKAGSAMLALNGISTQPDWVEKVVSGYGIVGQALQSNSPVPYSREVVHQAYRIASVINGHVTSISFESDGQVSEISEAVIEDDLLDEKVYEFGTITGTATTLLRKPFGISVADSLFERAVQCYVPVDYEEMMREAWGKRVEVTGFIYRNPDTGRPETVKGVVDLVILEEARDPMEIFEAASGIISRGKDNTPSEVIIRRLKNTKPLSGYTSANPT